ncbi:molybdate ABC transporter substrate-binding protein [Sagittula stellata]|uniref:Putative molybdate-binding periplasmic abc transporter protein n=1 Tax=Sagittula stellata (strain ATCC 700073 / DSM 11524 / E-37) TaxID=388399 RepID=A3K3A2_SAGS3|nr:molybdate ABC transporter substrate-binding protein [Sagittula stellata]EBA08661.1 putative molybdate-binding periplasmic abc transporter protein [Sagittula stellata E-37]
MTRLFLTLPLLLSLAVPAAAREITIFAAASLRDALDEAAELYSNETGDDTVISYAGSSALARQIQQGAPADVFISANAGWMDALEEDGLLAPGTRRDLLGNSLVLVAGVEGPVDDLTPASDLAGWLEGGKLAMALVDAVPAGIYGKAALEHLGLWDTVAAQVAQADNVRAALALVAVGAAPLGIVYRTDAQAEPRVFVKAAIPRDSHPPILYPAAAMAEKQQFALPFLSFLETGPAQDIFRRHGFTVMAE